MNERDTQYSNTDLDLKSTTSLESLADELRPICSVLYCTHGEDGNWHLTVEALHDCETADRNAAIDVRSMLDAIATLPEIERQQFNNCFHRDFNIGFECWDTWGYNQGLPHDIVRAIADAGCTVSVTLYPMRNPDGTEK